MNLPSGLPHFDEWRSKARELLIKGVHPQDADWDSSPRLIQEFETKLHPLSKPTIPSEFLDLSQFVARSNHPDRWALLYRLAYRLNHETKNLLQVSVDPDVHLAQTLAKSVRRDIHKMHAFVRFKKTEVHGQETFVAWHRPEHPCLELAAPFFVRRFGDKPWSIFTPEASAHWDLKELTYGDGMQQADFDHLDPFDEVWKTYYSSIFNPARLKIKMMKTEMPTKYWSSMPESEIIQKLIRETPKRLQNMAAEEKFQAKPPVNASWPELKSAALGCSACPLAAKANHTVFGEGNVEADLMIVGEQPGDEEDLSGKIFVGPAGQVLSEALKKAGIDRKTVYITNAVKHFKWTPGGDDGKARIHKKASGSEMQACKPWLEAEITRVKPKVIIALGATAGTALFGRLVKIQQERGRLFTDSHFAPNMLISWHPAAILRSLSEEERLQRQEELAKDLAQAFQVAKGVSKR